MSSSAHPADGELRALLDRELPAERQLVLEQHTATCSACRARLADLAASSQEIEALLDLLPVPEPALRVETIVRQAQRSRFNRWGAIAAMLTLLVATVAGATVGRPYVRALVARIRAVIHPAPPASPVAPTPTRQAGIAFVPGALADIAFDAAQSDGLLRVSLADSAELTIEPTAPVTYRVHPGGAVVHNQGSAASYEVTVPRDARHVRIAIAGHVVFEKIGSKISAATPVDAAGRYVLTLQ